MNFLMIGVEQDRSARRERPLRLFRREIEGDLVLGVGRLCRELVDVLSRQADERRVRVGVDGRLSGRQVRHGGGELQRG